MIRRSQWGMDNEAMGQGQGRRRRQSRRRRRRRRGSGREGRGRQQRGSTREGSNANNAPTPPVVGGRGKRRLIRSRRYRSHLGGKEAVGYCGGYTELTFCRLCPGGLISSPSWARTTCPLTLYSSLTCLCTRTCPCTRTPRPFTRPRPFPLIPGTYKYVEEDGQRSD